MRCVKVSTPMHKCSGTLLSDSSHERRKTTYVNCHILNYLRLTFHLSPGAVYSRCPGLVYDRSPNSVSKPRRVCGGYAPFLICLLTH